MKMNIEQLLKISADSNSFGGMSDMLSMMVESTQKKLAFCGLESISDEELSMVAGGTGEQCSKTEELNIGEEW